MTNLDAREAIIDLEQKLREAYGYIDGLHAEVDRLTASLASAEKTRAFLEAKIVQLEFECGRD